MKKIITIILLSVTLKSVGQNNIGVGVGSAVAAGTLITTYFYMNQKELKTYSNIKDPDTTINKVRQNNAPYLFCGIGCAILSVASFTNIDLGHGLSANFKGDGVSIAYQIK